MKNLNTTSTFSENILPAASGNYGVGTQVYAFSEGNFGTLRADTGYISDLYISGTSMYIGSSNITENVTGGIDVDKVGIKGDIGLSFNSLGTMWPFKYEVLDTGVRFNLSTGAEELVVDGVTVSSRKINGEIVTTGNITGRDVFPDASGSRDVGAPATSYANVYADDIYSSHDKVIGDNHFVVTIASSGAWGCAEAIPIWQAPRGNAVTIKEVRATAMGSSTPTYTFNIEERAWTSLNSAGTDLFGSDQIADSDGVKITGLSNEGIAAGAHLVFTAAASADSGTVNYVTVAGYYTID